MQFNRIALAVLESQFKELRVKQFPGACPDQYVGKILDIVERGKFEDGERKCVETIKKDDRENCLILILESPHVEEFINIDKPVPANGNTGKAIAKYLKQVNGLSKYCEGGYIVAPEFKTVV